MRPPFDCSVGWVDPVVNSCRNIVMNYSWFHLRYFGREYSILK
jgi:hypothetical protein